MTDLTDLMDLGLGNGRIYRPGELVAPGRYTRLEQPSVFVTLDQPGYLPASFDGTVALYVKVTLAQDVLHPSIAYPLMPVSAIP